MVTVIEPLSMAAFAQKYHSSIRLTMSWPHLSKCPTGLTVLQNDEKIHLLQRREVNIKGYGLGEYHTVKPGPNKTIFRAPALRYGNEYLLLDGNSRIQFYKPALIILDCIRPEYFYLVNYIDQGLNFINACRRV